MGSVYTNSPAMQMYRDTTTSEATGIKASAGRLHGVYALNGTGAIAYFQAYDATSDNVTIGTTTPDLTIPVGTGGQMYLTFPGGGAKFANAITAFFSTNTSGGTGVGTGTVVASMLYV